MTTVRSFSGRSTRRIKQAVDTVLGFDNTQGGPTRGGYQISEVISGVITARSGSGSNVVYTARGELQSDIVTESLKVPLDRCQDPTVVLIVPASIGSRCSIVRILNAQGEPIYRIGRAYGEVWSVRSCDTGGGAGLASSGITTAVEHSRDKRQLTELPWLEQMQSVTSGAAGKFGFKLYTFPGGYLMLHDLIMSLRAVSSAPTNVLRFAIGSAVTSGTGTTLTGTEADIWPQTMFGDFSVSLTRDYVGDLSTAGVTLPKGWNGSSTPLAIYLNFCPSANWTANGTITVSQKSTAARAFSLAWRNGGVI